ncbi:hypothetical protein DFJ73DRAFT_906517 [Zopfochytrium polystomum]|nr:hypothetical protein DFJ73DRAFT_906517 [Zopfochytrium polystomum]
MPTISASVPAPGTSSLSTSTSSSSTSSGGTDHNPLCAALAQSALCGSSAFVVSTGFSGNATRLAALTAALPPTYFPATPLSQADVDGFLQNILNGPVAVLDSQCGAFISADCATKLLCEYLAASADCMTVVMSNSTTVTDSPVHPSASSPAATSAAAAAAPPICTSDACALLQPPLTLTTPCTTVARSLNDTVAWFALATQFSCDAATAAAAAARAATSASSAAAAAASATSAAQAAAAGSTTSSSATGALVGGGDNGTSGITARPSASTLLLWLIVPVVLATLGAGAIIVACLRRRRKRQDMREKPLPKPGDTRGVGSASDEKALFVSSPVGLRVPCTKEMERGVTPPPSFAAAVHHEDTTRRIDFDGTHLPECDAPLPPLPAARAGETTGGGSGGSSSSWWITVGRSPSAWRRGEYEFHRGGEGARFSLASTVSVLTPTTATTTRTPTGRVPTSRRHWPNRAPTQVLATPGHYQFQASRDVHGAARGAIAESHRGSVLRLDDDDDEEEYDAALLVKSTRAGSSQSRSRSRNRNDSENRGGGGSFGGRGRHEAVVGGAQVSGYPVPPERSESRTALATVVATAAAVSQC